MSEMKRVVVFGLGKIFRTFMNLYDESKMQIVALSDNDKSLHDTTVSGFMVVKPENIYLLEYDYIVITSSYYDSIESQLVSMNIPRNIILNFNEIYKKLIVTEDVCLLNLMKSNLIMRDTDCNDRTVELMSMQEKNLFMNARCFINANCNKAIDSLEEVEFQVFSQFGEDGIIQWLIHNVDIAEKTFIEFGVEDYSESNTRFLLMNNNWTGFVMDGSKENIYRLKTWGSLWKYDLLCEAVFISKDNINQLITDAGFSGDIGILSVDLDGNDYWILNTIDCVKPRIVICEYNNIFGANELVTVPYDPTFVRTEKHYSNLYWGVSIAALRDWAENNGYYYMGSNSAGNNAFFVRKDCISKDMIPTNSNVFVESKYRESRGGTGEMTYLRGKERLECIKEMDLFNIKTNSIERIADIYNL